MASGFTITTEGAEALAASTAETILMIVGAANVAFRLVEFGISFDGVTSDAVPALVELVSSTQATAGTNTGATEQQIRGPADHNPQCTGFHSYTAEPTVLSVVKEWFVPQFMGGLVVQFPLGREFEQVTSADGIGIRVTASATVNCRAYMEWEEG